MKKTVLRDYRVILNANVKGYHEELKPFGNGGTHFMEHASKRRAEELLAQVHRHVDIEKMDVSVEPTVLETCFFCDSVWTERSSVYNGGCCEEDEKNNPSPGH